MRHFDEMWRETIFPTLCSTYDAIYDDTIRNNTILNKSKKYIYVLEKEYDHLRDQLKEDWYNHTNVNSEENLLDLHKIGAVVCSALIKYKPFVFDEKLMNDVIKSHNSDMRYVIDNCYINYKAAFETGMEIAFTGWIESLLEEESSTKIQLVHDATQLNGFVIYEKGKSHEGFEDTMISLLAENDLKGKRVDLIMLAAIYFQWEKYTSIKFFEKR